MAETPLSTIMRPVETAFALHFNRLYRQQDHVFQGRYRSILCEKRSYLLELIRYIHLNPVRARLVDQASQWKWSSLAAYLDREEPGWLYRAEVLELFGSNPHDKLLEFLSQAPSLSASQVYQPEGFPLLGSPPFQQKAFRYHEPGRHLPRSLAGPKLPLKALAERIGRAYQFPADQLVGPHKGQHRRAELRRLLVYAASEYFFYRPN